jgi:hypothetical protein
LPARWTVWDKPPLYRLFDGKIPDAAAFINEMSGFSVLNDHLGDGSHPEAPYTNGHPITERSWRSIQLREGMQ